MKFTFTQASMRRCLQRVMGAVPTKMPMPSLGNLFLKLENNQLEITATDLEITVTATVEIIDAEGSGSVLIQAKRFQELINQLPDVPLEIEIKEPFKVILKGEGVGEYTLPGGDPVDFPELPAVDAQISFTVPGETLRRLISKTMFAVSHDEMRPILTGTLMQLRAGELRVVATDGHRMSRITRRGIESTSEPRDVVIPMKALNLLMRSLDDSDEPVIGIAETRASFTTGSQKLTTRLIDGHYPKYESVIPENNPFKMTANTGDLMAIVKRVSIFANQISHQVKIKLDGDIASFETEDPEIGGRGEEQMHISYEGEPLEIAYNANYLMDVMKQVDTDEVIFSLNKSNDAAIIRASSTDENEDFLMLLMPIRIK